MTKQPDALQRFLAAEAEKEILRFSTAGSVDDGKSTLIGRLLHDAKSIYEDQLAAVKGTRGSVENGVDWALLTDGLKAEREQGITIDVAYRYFATPKRKFIIADTPGHEQYTRNMATGASCADLAIILVDARKGVLPQSKRHAFIASLLQIPHVVVAVNKMDLVDYNEQTYTQICTEFSAFASRLSVHDVRFIPISALNGDNVVDRSTNMPWYRGDSLLDILNTIHIASDRNLVDMRFPVQMVVRPNQDFRGYAGQVASGILRPGKKVVVLPGMRETTIAAIHTFDGPLDLAQPPQSVTVTLADNLDISRGDMLVYPGNRPRIGRQFEAMVVWMDDTPMDPALTYQLKHTSRRTRASIAEVRYKVAVESLHKQSTDHLQLNEIGRVAFTTHQPLLFDPYERNRTTGAFILIHPENYRTVAAGMIIDRLPADQLPARMDRTPHQTKHREYTQAVHSAERAQRLKQQPVTLWLTGLLGSGKARLAEALERHIFDAGGLATVLHGGVLRRGLSRELEFNTADIAEHLRRMAETAHLFNKAGLITICNAISPRQQLRSDAREIIGADRYLEVFVDAPVSWCAERDASGLYQKAQQGDLATLPGVTAPYEPPHHPDVHLHMDQLNLDQAIARVMQVLMPFLTGS